MADANVNGSTHQHAVATNAGHHGAIVRMQEENVRLRTFARMVADNHHADDCGGCFEEPAGCWGELAREALR